MKDIKILFLTRRGEGYVGAPQTRHEFEQEVAKHCTCKFAGEGWPLYRAEEPMDLTVKRVMPDADWVIDRDNNLHNRKPSKRKRSYKVGLFISDLHGKHHYGLKTPVEFVEMINKAGYDGVFMRYKYVYGTHYSPDVAWRLLRPDVYFVPWSVDPERFQPSRSKPVDVAAIGSAYRCYPLRRSINASIYYACRGRKILVKTAPTGGTFERDVPGMRDRGFLVGEDYEKALGDTRIFITGCSIYSYPLQKLFQSTAAGCMLLCNEPSTAKLLGFLNDRTYFMINEYTWEQALKYFLENPTEVRVMARRGRKNTLLHHTHRVRAEEFLEVLG